MLRNALFSNLGLRKFSTFWKFQNYFLHLIFRYLNSATDFLPIDINFNVKGYDVSYFYQKNNISDNFSAKGCFFHKKIIKIENPTRFYLKTARNIAIQKLSPTYEISEKKPKSNLWVGPMKKTESSLWRHNMEKIVEILFNDWGLSLALIWCIVCTIIPSVSKVR